MMPHKRPYRFVRLLVALLIALSFVSAPYHSHASPHDAVTIVASAAQVDAGVDGHSDDGPFSLKDNCAGCVLMKHVQMPTRHQVWMRAPIEGGTMMDPPLEAGQGPRSAIHDVFRPPIGLLV